MSLSDAIELETELAAILPEALVVLDPRQADAALERLGKVVVVINPPKLTKIDTLADAGISSRWSVTVAAGPAEDIVKAWSYLSPAVNNLLADPDLDFTEAEPSAFRTQGGKDMPAYVLTLET
jgi:hypothetical protein